MSRTTVNREQFIQTLELVQPGLSPREIIEQSSCIIVNNKLIQTFNDEIACSMETALDFTGAIQAAPLLKLLHKMPETEVDIENTKEELIVYGKRSSAGIRMEAEVTLPVENVERPKKWKDLHEEFVDAVKLVHSCVGKNEAAFALTCVHIHPKWVEACDNDQVARYKLPTGFSTSVMVRGRSIKHIVGIGVSEFAETDTWVHFKTGNGLVLSCRRHLEDYPNLNPMLKVDGTALTLPKGLVEAAERADIFSSENADENLVTVTLRAGKLRIRGEGVSGWYKEPRKIKYDGPPLTFLVNPLLLQEIVKRMNECEVTEDRLKVNGGRWVYVSCLGKAESNGEGKEEK